MQPILLLLWNTAELDKFLNYDNNVYSCCGVLCNPEWKGKKLINDMGKWRNRLLKNLHCSCLFEVLSVVAADKGEGLDTPNPGYKHWLFWLSGIISPHSWYSLVWQISIFTRIKRMHKASGLFFQCCLEGDSFWVCTSVGMGLGVVFNWG